MKRITAVSGVVLAGGLSTRIGRDKGSLDIGGRKQWLRAVDRLRSWFTEVVYVTNDRAFVAPYPDLIVAYDDVPHLGPLGGILAGLKAATNERVFVVAYDMPFVQDELVRFLVDIDPRADVTVPVVGGKYEPLHAVYGRGCVPHIEARLRAGKRKLVAFYPAVDVNEVPEAEIRRFDPELRSFFNINTWEDVRLAESIITTENERKTNRE